MGIVHHDKESGKVIGFSQNLVGDFVDKEYYHDFLVNGGFMVFKKEVFGELKDNSMLEQAFIPLAKKANCPCISTRESGKQWILIKRWKN